MPEVVEWHRITGEDCFILRVYLEELDALDHVIDRFLAHGQTTTSLVQSSPVPPRGLPLPEAWTAKAPRTPPALLIRHARPPCRASTFSQGTRG